MIRRIIIRPERQGREAVSTAIFHEDAREVAHMSDIVHGFETEMVTITKKDGTTVIYQGFYEPEESDDQ